MELPFTPSFFKEIEIYQRLMSLEKENKTIWESEKLVLSYAAGPGHAHPGTPLGRDHVGEVIENAVNNGKISSKAIKVSGHQDVLNSLVTRGFAEAVGVDRARITQEGLFAGKILNDTNLLKKRQKYITWIFFWWIVFGFAVLLLLCQSIVSVIELINKFL